MDGLESVEDSIPTDTEIPIWNGPLAHEMVSMAGLRCLNCGCEEFTAAENVLGNHEYWSGSWLLAKWECTNCGATGYSEVEPCSGNHTTSGSIEFQTETPKLDGVCRRDDR